MNRPIKNNLPAGLMDLRCEFFVEGTEVYALYNSKVYAFDEFPYDLKKTLEEDMLKYPEAISALVEIGLLQDDQMLKQYTRCRFGGFDGEPDIVNGELKHTEYWECGCRSNCAYEGKLCPSIKVANGHLTKREIDILKCIAEGMIDKEIADHLHISVNTVPVFKKNIQDKTGLLRKPDMVKFAILKNIVLNINPDNHD